MTKRYLSQECKGAQCKNKQTKATSIILHINGAKGVRVFPINAGQHLTKVQHICMTGKKKTLIKTRITRN